MSSRQPSTPTPAANVATLVARAGLYWDSYKAGFFVRDENDSGEACMARFARLVTENSTIDPATTSAISVLLDETKAEMAKTSRGSSIWQRASDALASASITPVVAAAASTKPCPTCSAPCETTVNPRGGEYGWGTTDAERTTYRYAGVVR